MHTTRIEVTMKCSRCHNEEEKYFYNDDGVYYCRKCIMFGRVNVGEKLVPPLYKTQKHRCHYQLDYELTSYQKNVVKQLNSFLKQGQDVLVYAATGAGKTEIVMESIENYLNEGKKVCMAIARRQVVLEICGRMKKAFPTLHVIPVCEGYTNIIDGDLIICTMHQLHRYYQSFDLLIMDEVDAFPYKGNEVLEAIAKHSCKGLIVYLTATPDEFMLKDIEAKKLAVVKLFCRPHGYDLCVPNVYRVPLFIQWLLLFRFLKEHQKRKQKVLVFVPTIKMSESLSKVLNIFFKCQSFTSKTKDKERIAKAMREGEYDFLVATTVLERGITIAGVDIIIVQANHIVFDEASLIQIAGRAGRSMDQPFGEVVFLCDEKSEGIKQCLQTIQKMNKKN